MIKSGYKFVCILLIISFSTLINHFELPSHLPFTLNTYSCTKSANKLAINNSSSLFVAPIKSSKVSVIKYRFCLIVSSVHLADFYVVNHSLFLISQQFPVPFKAIPSETNCGNDGLPRSQSILKKVLYVSKL